MDKKLFSEMNLSREVLKAVHEMGFEMATPIQTATIPLLMEGKDITGQSQTGTGKTAAFAIPAIENVDVKKLGVQTLVLCPTRELCIQVAEEFSKLSKHKKGLMILPIYGGQSYDRQILGLKKGAQIVIGTPGRLIDHLERKTLILDAVRTVVLDEADEMLDMGFQEDLETILKTTPAERQTVLFSATLPTSIRHLIKRYLKNPQTVQVAQEALAVPLIDQSYVEVRQQLKLEALCRFIEFYNIKSAFVFCNTKLGVDDLVGHLQARGYFADGLHGDLKQSARDRVMNKFRAGNVEILVATDVAARGIDVNNLEAVFNYDFPQDEEDYVHRIGRTGRAGKSGRAVTFVSSRDLYKLRHIQTYAKVKIQRQAIPSLGDIEAMKAAALMNKVKETLQAGNLSNYSQLVENLVEENFTAHEIAAALLKMMLPNQENGAADGAEHLMPGKLYLNVGNFHRVQARDIVGALTNLTGLASKDIGHIDVQGKFSLVELPANAIDEIVQKLSGKKLKGYVVQAKRAEY